MLIIILFTLILNAVSILLMYKCLNGIDKKERWIFVIIGTALMYVVTNITYWFGTKNIQISEETLQLGKDLIIFLFVPINGILILPLFAKSYMKFKLGNIDFSILRNRGIVLLVILLIILIIEGIYFGNIQKQVLNIINQKNNKIQENINSLNEVEQNTENVINEITNEIVNEMQNDTINEESNQITNDIQNVIE